MALRKNSRTKSLSLSDEHFTPRPKSASLAAKRTTEDPLKTIKYIDESVIGKGLSFLGPFGRRKLVYGNYDESGRSLQFIEDYILKEVLPTVGNSGCASSLTGFQTKQHHKEASDLVKIATNASSDDHVIFCDNPQERVCFLLTQELNNNRSGRSRLNSGDDLCIQNECSSGQPSFECAASGPILFVNGTEPIENYQFWIDCGVQIERISENHDGFLDLIDLERRLDYYSKSRRTLIGLFAGASRFTGILADDVATTILLHQHGAIAIWDFSSAIGSVPLNANPNLPGSEKDAVYFKGKALVGGLQSSGVLIFKKHLVQDYTSFLNHSQDIVKIVRTALAAQLKQAIGAQVLSTRLEKICKQVLSHVRTIPEINMIGSSFSATKRMPAICFLVRHPRGAFLHHRFVVAVLNDVFGVQATAQDFIGQSLGISGHLAVEFEKVLADETNQNENLRPGFVKITLPFFMSESEVGFILEAIKMTATESWKLMPQYDCDPATGEWRHHSNSLVRERKFLGSIRYTDGRMQYSDRRISGCGTFPQGYSECLQTARNLFNRSRKMAIRGSPQEHLNLKLRRDFEERLRWYMLPGEAHELLLGHSQFVKTVVPFDPNKLMEPSLFSDIHRHNSLSALDVKRYKSQSLPASPVQMLRQCSSPTPKYPESASPPILRFSLGGEVTCVQAVAIPQAVSNLRAEGGGSRTRCHSWGAPTNIPKIKRSSSKPQSPLYIEGRSCSCSSQTKFSFDEHAFSPDIQTTNSPVFTEPPTRESSFSDISSHDIQAYVQEVSNEIATELKSEIREVINKVEDVLESTDSIDIANLSSLGNTGADSVSATDVVEYLKDFAKEMTSEVTSEIRDAVNEMIAPDTLSSKKDSPPPPDNVKQPEMIRPEIIVECHKNRSESLPTPKTTKARNSHDSGINVGSVEEENARNVIERSRTISAVTCTSDLDSSSNDECLPKVIHNPSFKRNSLEINEDSDDVDADKWQNLPKELWKQVAEVNEI